MILWSVLRNVADIALSATVVIALWGLFAKYLSDRLLEQVRAQHSKNLAEFAHQNSVLLGEMQNAFSLGATSHMAAVAFDKHIEFCEEYVAAVSNVLQSWNENGAPALCCATALSSSS